MYHCVPTKDNEEIPEIKGAYITCWVESENLNAAVAITRETLANLSWEIVSLEEGHVVTACDYAGKSEGKEFFEQALIDKEVYNIHTYLKED